MTNLVCPWCEVSLRKLENTSSVYSCWCHGDQRTACQVQVLFGKINSFHVYSEYEDHLCCFFINNRERAHWGIESMIAKTPAVNDILYISDGVIDLPQAVDKLHQFKKLKAFF